MKTILLGLLISCLSLAVHGDPGTATPIQHALADSVRPDTDRQRDAYRKPCQVIAFSGIKSGHKVVEIAPAGGYYTALLSRLVGPDGHIFAVDPKRIFEVFPDARDGFQRFITRDPRDNVTYSIQNMDTINIPDQIDQIWMILYYHDTVWTGEDRAAMNKAFYDALRPGGVYLVIDHHAIAGSPDSITKDLHRMDGEIAMAEILEAGFELATTTDILAFKDDPRDDSVFLEQRRGKTDRFVWLFTKPE